MCPRQTVELERSRDVAEMRFNDCVHSINLWIEGRVHAILEGTVAQEGTRAPVKVHMWMEAVAGDFLGSTTFWKYDLRVAAPPPPHVARRAEGPGRGGVRPRVCASRLL